MLEEQSLNSGSTELSQAGILMGFRSHPGTQSYVARSHEEFGHPLEQGFGQEFFCFPFAHRT